MTDNGNEKLAALADVELNREAVAVFDDATALEAAIDELRLAGFSRAQISLLATEEAVEEKLGSPFWTSPSLEDAPEAPHAEYVSKESLGAAEGGVVGALLYVGAVSAAIAMAGAPILVSVVAVAAAGAAASVAGGALAGILGEEYAESLETQIRHGGLLLWVRTFDEAQEAKALEILKRCSGRDVHLHGERAEA